MGGKKKTAMQKLMPGSHTNEGEQNCRMIAEAVT